MASEKVESFAIVKSGGKQLRMILGRQIAVARMEAEIGSEVNFDQVLLVSSADGVKVGAPLIKGAKVSAKIVAHDRAKKVLIYKKRRRKGYTKKQGHRQDQTLVRIEAITAA